ncbi:MAG: carboxypeptidase M32, partial [Pseudomonadota bacterium]
AGHESELFWRSARKENDFKGFAPYQKRVLQLVRESAQAKSAALGLSPYDALIDQYDPGTKSDFIDGIFNDLAEFLPEFTGQVIERQKSQTPPLQINDNVSKAAQKELGIEFMQKLGFDFSQGRLDESTHPFCGGVIGDVRITTRYDEKDFLSGFFGVMHETGHALYEMHLPKERRMQPVGQARGMAFHESQSLFTEMQLCIRKEFLQYAAPYMRKTLNKSGEEWHEDNIYKLMTQVTPSFIRVDADEVTYPAHIILRYRLERQLIEGTLEVEDLPDAWNEQMRLLLGIVPDNYANGCMQDIHWTDGSFGYFPSYTLGAMIAAQLFNSIEKAIPDINSVIRNGEFRQIYSWLHQNVHCLGSKYSSQDLLLKASGENLNINYYKNHLKTRYLAD